MIDKMASKGKYVRCCRCFCKTFTLLLRPDGNLIAQCTDCGNYDVVELKVIE